MINYKIHYSGEEIDELLDIVNGNINIKAIRTDAQELTDSQKAQARQNIGAIDETRAGEIDEEVKKTQELLAPVQETYIASKDYSIGEFLVLENKLYKVIDSIDSGETIVIDGNVVEASIGNEIIGINERINDVEDAILAKKEESAVATKNYLVDELLILEDVLYRVTANIASGEAIVVGTNVVATNVAEELGRLDAKKANMSGVYDDLTSGQAKQLMATVGTEDREPYLFRSSGGSIDVGDRKEEEFVGGTIAWNQLVQNGNFADTSGWSASGGDTITVENGTVTISGQHSQYSRIQRTNNLTAYATHKYLIMLKASSSSGRITVVPTGVASAGVFYFYNLVGETPLAMIWAPSENYTTLMWHVRFVATTQGVTEEIIGTLRDYCAYDLTQMFGTAIADHIYSLETSTPGAGVAWFRKLFPKAYYPYDTGTLRSVQFSAHETIGFNAFNPSTGTAKLLGGNQYQISGTYTSLAYENLDGESETITPDENGHFTPEKNGILTVTGGNGSDTCVHLVWSGYRDGEWEAFEKHEYEIEPVELRGIPQIDGNGSLYWDGDRYKSDGTVERRYGIVDLGAAKWSYNSTSAYFRTLLPAARPARSSMEKTTWALLNNGRYTFESPTHIVNNSSTYDKCIAINHTKYLFISDSTYTDAEIFKVSLSGVYLVYELETPTTETATPYTNPQIINDFGTEEFLDIREVPIPVGHKTFYAANLRDKLQHLPDLASSNGKYLISQNGTQMELVAPQTDSTLSLEGEFADAKATGDAINKTREMIAGREATTTATKNYSIGDLVIVSDTLYRVTAAIATGETIAEGTNITADTVADELAALDEKKADKVGEAPDLTSGQTRQLLSTVSITDEVPYNFRTSGGSLEIGDRETDEIVGGTVAWNQIVENGNFASESGWSVFYSSASYNNNVCTLTADGTATSMRIQRSCSTIVGHVYLATYDFDRSGAEYVTGTSLRLVGGTTEPFVTNITDAKGRYAAILKVAESGHTTVGVYFTRSGSTLIPSSDSATVSNINLFDLTLMFGTTIADYVYSLETANAGAGIAWFRKLFPNDYYAYDPGTLRSVNTSAKKTVGFNQFDKDDTFVNGYVNNSSKRYIANTSTRGLWIKCVPNTTYHFKKTKGGRFSAGSSNRILTSNEEFLNAYSTASSNEFDFTTAPNASYIFVWFYNANIDTGLTPEEVAATVCVNIKWDGERDGEYAPYEAHTYALDPVELRGVPMIDGNGSLCWDGDRYKSDGTVERRYAIVDMGTRAWAANTATQSQFYFILSSLKTGYSNTESAPLMCAKYARGKIGAIRIEPYTIGTGTSGGVSNTSVIVNDPNYTDVETFKASLSGVYLVYELATPTTETASPYTNPQIVDNWGTEEYIDADVESGDRDVAIPVGHVTQYPQDLRSKIEAAPNSPDADGDYIVRRENGVSKYVLLLVPEELPAAPSEDGIYRLSVTVTDGTPTLSWVADT